MARGAILATPPQGTNFDNYMYQQYLVKAAETVNIGVDLVGVDSNGFVVVASKTGGATVKAVGVAVLDIDANQSNTNSTVTTVVGDGTTVYVAIAKKAVITGPKSTPLNTTLVPGLAKGAPVYLGALTTTTVTNYTCTQTSTNTDLLQQVGWVTPDGLSLDIDVSTIAFITYQTAGNSVVGVS